MHTQWAMLADPRFRHTSRRSPSAISPNSSRWVEQARALRASIFLMSSSSPSKLRLCTRTSFRSTGGLLTQSTRTCVRSSNPTGTAAGFVAVDQAVARHFHGDAAVLHVVQASVLSDLPGLLRGDPQLEPDCLGPDGNSLPDDLRGLSRGAEHVHQVHGLRDVLQASVDLLSQQEVRVRIHRNDPVARHLHLNRNPPGLLVRIPGYADHCDHLGSPQNRSRIRHGSSPGPFSMERYPPAMTWEPPQIGARATWTRTIAAEDVELYAKVTGDRNPLHVDSGFAAATSFQRLVVQGGLTNGLFNALVAMELPGPGSVFLHQEWDYPAPVFISDTVTAEAEVIEARADKPITRLRCVARRQDGVEVLRGECLVYTVRPRAS